MEKFIKQNVSATGQKSASLKLNRARKNSQTHPSEENNLFIKL